MQILPIFFNLHNYQAESRYLHCNTFSSYQLDRHIYQTHVLDNNLVKSDKKTVWPLGLAPSPPPASTRCLTDTETGMRVTSQVGNLPSRYVHARPLGSRIIRYVRNGQIDGRIDKSNAYCSLPYGTRYKRGFWQTLSWKQLLCHKQ